MVTSTMKKRNDTVVRLSKWLDKEVEQYLKDRRVRIDFPSKRNFVDMAVLQYLEEKGVNISK